VGGWPCGGGVGARVLVLVHLLAAEAARARLEPRAIVKVLALVQIEGQHKLGARLEQVARHFKGVPGRKRYALLWGKRY